MTTVSKLGRWTIKSSTPYSVYAIKLGGKIFYVGITCGCINKRFRAHISESKSKECKNHKQNWIVKHEKEIAVHLIRSNLDMESAVRIERQIIKKLKGDLLNVSDGGEVGFSFPPNGGLVKTKPSVVVRIENRCGDVVVFKIKRVGDKISVNGNKKLIAPKSFFRRIGEIAELWSRE